jgi:hypothetical protein
VDRVHGSGGPRPGGGLRVHGGPQATAAERLTGARARGVAVLRSGRWWRLGRPREEDDARGGLGRSGRVGRMPLGPARRENKKK